MAHCNLQGSIVSGLQSASKSNLSWGRAREVSNDFETFGVDGSAPSHGTFHALSGYRVASERERILERRKIGMSGSVDELLHLGELARARKAHIEARLYLKIAMQSDLSRPEPYFQLGELAEIEGHAAHYYYMALDAQSNFQPARDALKRLGRLSRASIRKTCFHRVSRCPAWK